MRELGVSKVGEMSSGKSRGMYDVVMVSIVCFGLEKAKIDVAHILAYTLAWARAGLANAMAR